MKNIVKLLLFSLTIIISSCTKPDYHTLVYEITFLEKPSNGHSNMIDVFATPNYPEQKPFIDDSNIPKVWKYEYTQLEVGQKVSFSVEAQLSYRFEMRVYVDGKEVSYMRVKVSDYTYYDDTVEEKRGLNTYTKYDTAMIQFVYE